MWRYFEKREKHVRLPCRLSESTHWLASFCFDTDFCFGRDVVYFVTDFCLGRDEVHFVTDFCLGCDVVYFLTDFCLGLDVVYFVTDFFLGRDVTYFVPDFCSGREVVYFVTDFWLGHDLEYFRTFLLRFLGLFREYEYLMVFGYFTVVTELAFDISDFGCLETAFFGVEHVRIVVWVRDRPAGLE